MDRLDNRAASTFLMFWGSRVQAKSYTTLQTVRHHFKFTQVFE